VQEIMTKYRRSRSHLRRIGLTDSLGKLKPPKVALPTDTKTRKTGKISRSGPAAQVAGSLTIQAKNDKVIAE
jgi:hypothetical protein